MIMQPYPSPFSSFPPHSQCMMTFFSHVFTPLPLFLWKSTGFYLKHWPSSHRLFQLLLFSKKHFRTIPVSVNYPLMYILYPNTCHTLFHNCHFIYLYFLLDYTHHEGSGCISLIHCLLSHSLAQTGIRLMNAWKSKKTELWKYTDCWKIL